jgi:zinc transport system ATP-binding protein
MLQLPGRIVMGGIGRMQRQRPLDQPLIEAHDLSVRINGRSILHGVDLTIFPGQITTLIGPNGAGKTTLVRALLGLIPHMRGDVTRARGLNVGYMPQRLRIDPIVPLSVKRFLTLNNRVPLTEARRALEEVGAAHVERAPVQVISGGEFQRVLLARALLRKPEMLVLDEPAQGVDVVGQGELYKLIAALRSRYGCAVLMISQDLHVVMEAADSVICLNHHVCCTGKPEAVSRHPEYRKLFGAPEPGGLAVYTHHHDHDHDLHGSVVPLTEDPKQRDSEHAPRG